MDQTNLRYDHLIESHLEHLKREYRNLLIDDANLPQFWLLTVTYVAVEAKRDDRIPIPPYRCIALFERFYVRFKADEQFRTQANAAAVDVSLRRLPVHQAQEDIRYALTNQAVSRESISLPSQVSRDDSAHPRDHADPAAVGRAL